MQFLNKKHFIRLSFKDLNNLINQSRIRNLQKSQILKISLKIISKMIFLIFINSFTNYTKTIY
jgi:hypothetical protein